MPHLSVDSFSLFFLSLCSESCFCEANYMETLCFGRYRSANIRLQLSSESLICSSQDWGMTTQKTQVNFFRTNIPFFLTYRKKNHDANLSRSACRPRGRSFASLAVFSIFFFVFFHLLPILKAITSFIILSTSILALPCINSLFSPFVNQIEVWRYEIILEILVVMEFLFCGNKCRLAITYEFLCHS